MKIFRSSEVKKIDEYTVINEPVRPEDLMERAASKLFDWYANRFPVTIPVYLFTGPGNNGGDGLTLARIMSNNSYKPKVFYVDIGGTTSAVWKNKKERLINETHVPFNVINGIHDFPQIKEGEVIIDAIFGSGLTRPVEGLAGEVVRKINHTGATVISVDIPSGLFGEDNSLSNPENIIKADYTLSFQFPKLSFMFPENEKYTGEWAVLPIGLHQDVINRMDTPWIFIDKDIVLPFIKRRNKFDHKGNFGHALLTGGSYGKTGAIALGAKAALRTGAGLLSCHIPSSGNIILQTYIPEAMVINDRSDRIITEKIVTDKYNALGIGPGMGTEPETQEVLHEMIKQSEKKIVIDADGLNILSMNRKWLDELPYETVLTPHPKEFERLTGNAADGYARLMKQMEFAHKYRCIVVLKGAYTSVADTDGKVWFNSSGNPGMATAGSGDVLTGMILSLLAQGYNALAAAITGVFIHGLAGDIAAEKISGESLIASDIVDSVGEAFKRIRE
ncbi:MAG TPA: NAD(P)H-hydrate dehydratase [Bacteroidales bacterium]|nr:NAD(P)H-hydrate dehydratase [Bacteroidales bacterium]HPI68057.1 NAD(P)H-hydrate dehydratase [Bacteroidales bacterium]HPR72545.1 NAD(P)H-hydrate dehydratase [Bacteroidales bacterium]